MGKQRCCFLIFPKSIQHLHSWTLPGSNDLLLFPCLFLPSRPLMSAARSPHCPPGSEPSAAAQNDIPACGVAVISLESNSGVYRTLHIHQFYVRSGKHSKLELM